MNPTRSLIVLMILTFGICRASAQMDTDSSAEKPAALPAAQPAHAEQHLVADPRAREILLAARDKLANGMSATVISYAADNAMLTGILPHVEGLWIQQTTSPTQWQVRYTGSATDPKNPEPIGFDVLWTPQWTTWKEFKNKTLNIKPTMARNTGESFAVAQSAWSQAGDVARGFGPQLKAPGLELRDDAEVDGVPCHVVAVTSKAQAEPVLWYFGIDDQLPRRCERPMPEQLGGGGIRVDFKDIELGAPPPDATDWTISKPDGWSESISPAYKKRTQLKHPKKSAANALQTGPEWEVIDSEGKSLNAHSLGNKVTVLYFWGTWSPLCKKATPEVIKLAKDYADKPVGIVSMAMRDGDPKAVVEVARKQGQTWRQVPTADDAAAMLGVRVAPSVVVLDAFGRVLYKAGRPMKNDYEGQYQEVRQVIDKALKATPKQPVEDKRSGVPAPRQPAEHQ